ncbi:hypothetical protein J6590_066065 [Homalodisca vitripennis]|nr:hypothetical protein J6590_066065 [Homalodisca vitripennis]
MCIDLEMDVDKLEAVVYGSYVFATLYPISSQKLQTSLKTVLSSIYPPINPHITRFNHHSTHPTRPSFDSPTTRLIYHSTCSTIIQSVT